MDAVKAYILRATTASVRLVADSVAQPGPEDEGTRAEAGPRSVDPDNPPIPPGTKMEPYKPYFLRRIAAHEARVERLAQQKAPNPVTTQPMPSRERPKP